MESEELIEITRTFLENFLPPWDTIKDFTVKKEFTIVENSETQVSKAEADSIILFQHNNFPSVNKISVRVSFENAKKKPLHLIIKTPFVSSSAALRKLKCFHKEVFFHEEIIEEFKQLQNKCDSKDKHLLKLNTPPIIAASVSDVTDDPLETFIATSDIRFTRGFESPKQNSERGLDFTHCKLVIKELAKLHALSWAYRKSKAVLSLQVLHPILQENFFCEKNKENLKSLLANRLTLMKTLELENTFGADSKQLETLENVIKNGIDVSDILIQFVNYKGFNRREVDEKLLTGLKLNEQEDCAQEFEWAVGSHGDVRSENLLFRYNLNNHREPVEVSLLNFGCYRECCPTIDLVYFIYTSADVHTRETHCQQLLKIYMDTFNYFCCTLLKKDPYPDFSIDSLTRRFNRAKIFGLLTAICILQQPKDSNKKFLECSECETFAKKQEKCPEISENNSFTSDLDNATTQPRIS